VACNIRRRALQGLRPQASSAAPLPCGAREASKSRASDISTGTCLSKSIPLFRLTKSTVLSALRPALQREPQFLEIRIADFTLPAISRSDFERDSPSRDGELSIRSAERIENETAFVSSPSRETCYSDLQARQGPKVGAAHAPTVELTKPAFF
jgi:hypothetical protein